MIKSINNYPVSQPAAKWSIAQIDNRTSMMVDRAMALFTLTGGEG